MILSEVDYQWINFERVFQCVGFCEDLLLIISGLVFHGVERFVNVM